MFVVYNFVFLFFFFRFITVHPPSRTTHERHTFRQLCFSGGARPRRRARSDKAQEKKRTPTRAQGRSQGEEGRRTEENDPLIIEVMQFMSFGQQVNSTVFVFHKNYPDELINLSPVCVKFVLLHFVEILSIFSNSKNTVKCVMFPNCVCILHILHLIRFTGFSFDLVLFIFELLQTLFHGALNLFDRKDDHLKKKTLPLPFLLLPVAELTELGPAD